ncbi:MAG: glycosyltransferase [Acidimicrobiales bacterium]
MIFVTVGTALGFERFVDAVDAWAALHPDVTCFAQIGQSDAPPQHMDRAASVDADRFRDLSRRATVIAAHAGMGTIIDALAAGTPVIIFPRRADLNEQRNDHQLATVDHFADRKGIHAARTVEELTDLLDRRDQLEAPDPIGPDASPELIDGLRQFFDEVASSKRLS